MTPNPQHTPNTQPQGHAPRQPDPQQSSRNKQSHVLTASHPSKAVLCWLEVPGATWHIPNPAVPKPTGTPVVLQGGMAPKPAPNPRGANTIQRGQSQEEKRSGGWGRARQARPTRCQLGPGAAPLRGETALEGSWFSLREPAWGERACREGQGEEEG